MRRQYLSTYFYQFEVYKWNVEDEAADDKDGCVQELYLRILHDGRNHEVDGAQQEQHRNHYGDLRMASIVIIRW